MSEDLLNQLRENGQLASQTAQVLARLLETSSLADDHRDRMRPAIESKQLELALLVDRIGLLEHSPETGEMLRAAAIVERLWEEIAAKLDMDH
jgi:hypothetical protein